MRTGSMRVAEISLPAIRHNVGRMRELTGGNIIAVVKADGYGHGAAIAAEAALAGGAAMIATADLEEALALREAGVAAPLLCWLHGARIDFKEAVEADIEIGVSHLQQLEALGAAAAQLGRRASMQFKVDTGLSRNGAAPEEWSALFARAAELEKEGLVRVRGIFSHLANAGDEADRAQAARFDEAVAMLQAAGIEPEMIHLAASAAALSSPHLHYNTVRVGITVYGLSPFADRSSAQLGLVPAMTLRSEIVALRSVPAGTGVSYGFNHVCETDTTLALVPMGYADGLPRALNGAGASVTVAGEKRPIVGRIGMDQIIVDVGPLAEQLSLGDPVVLFGNPELGHPEVEIWADLMHTINYEIVAGVGSRVLRVPSDAEPAEPVRLAPQEASAGVADAVGSEAVAGRETVPDNAAVPEAVVRVVEVDDPDAMHRLGVQLGQRLRAGDLVLLTGPLGAGKTGLTRGLGEGLGVRGPVQSPTFVLARTHPSLVGGAPLVHVDAYRLADPGELDDLDLDFEGSVVVAEWGLGVVETRGSWIEITIERPVGDGDEATPVATTDTVESGDAAGSERCENAEPDWSESPVEPRTVTIAGHGPRWAEGVL
ncbi:MAG: alanine racemase [Leucobacter sp.]